MCHTAYVTGAQWGFTGKQVIHPSQVDIVQQCFTPEETRQKWAKALVEVRAKVKQWIYF